MNFKQPRALGTKQNVEKGYNASVEFHYMQEGPVAFTLIFLAGFLSQVKCTVIFVDRDRGQLFMQYFDILIRLVVALFVQGKEDVTNFASLEEKMIKSKQDWPHKSNS